MKTSIPTGPSRASHMLLCTFHEENIKSHERNLRAFSAQRVQTHSGKHRPRVKKEKGRRTHQRIHWCVLFVRASCAPCVCCCDHFFFFFAFIDQIAEQRQHQHSLQWVYDKFISVFPSSTFFFFFFSNSNMIDRVFSPLNDAERCTAMEPRKRRNFCAH